MTLDEAAYRELLDERGVLDGVREVAMPSSAVAFTVFAQCSDARIEIAEWRRHAELFLETRLGLTVDKRYEGVFPARDVARVVLAPLWERESTAHAGASGTRICWGRARTAEDLEAARNAEGAGAGLADLVARCQRVWLVETEHEDDAVALRLAAIIAGVLLGPILAPHGAALFGPRTARARLA